MTGQNSRSPLGVRQNSMTTSAANEVYTSNDSTPEYRSAEPRNESSRLTDTAAATRLTAITPSTSRPVHPVGRTGERRSPASHNPPATTTVIHSTASFGSPKASASQGLKVSAANAGPTTTTTRAQSWNRARFIARARLASQRHADDRLVERHRPGRSEEPGVAEVEDPAVAGNEPVPLSGRGGQGLDDRLVQRHLPGGPEERGAATEREDPAVGGHQPVTQPVWRRRHAHDRLVQRHRPGRTEEPSVTEREHPAIARHQPIARTGRRRRHAHDRLAQRHRPGRTEEP